MEKIFIKTIVIVLFLALSVNLRASDPVLVPYNELNARAGLPNFFYKLHQGKGVKIAYFGGSITDAGSGWRDQTMQWFKIEYPKCDILQKNASLPGTGSDFGAFRADKDVISFKPDLVFIEFAVNDNGSEASEISKSMEGIVRKIRKTLPTCEICFVYTICQDMAATLATGMLPISASTMEKVADYYGIPSIFMGVEILKFAKDDHLVWKGKIEEQPGKFVFAGDGVHPLSQTGHKLYTEAVSRSMLNMETISKLQKHILPKPLNKDNYEQATMIPVSELIKKDPNWEYLQKGDAIFDRFSHLLPELAKSRNADATIQVKFKGSKIGLLDIMGPSSCFVNVTVNDSAPKLYKRFDPWCTWYRINYLTVDEIKKQGTYSVTFKVSDVHFNKKEILLENADNKGVELNDEYKSYNYFAGYVMLIGKIIPN